MTNWAAINSITEAKSQICTRDPFEPDSMLAEICKETAFSVVLDYGCGIGRNIKWIEENLNDVVICGYDFANMIGMAKDYLGSSVWNAVNWFYAKDDFEKLKMLKDPLIIASHVLQHFNATDVTMTLELFSAIIGNGKLFIRSRWNTDYGERVWDRVCEYFDPITPVDRSATEPDNHQCVLFSKP